jgi:hypothetical protein
VAADALTDVLEDSYVRNRSTQSQRERLLERPEVVAALGEPTITELERALHRGEPTTAARA